VEWFENTKRRGLAKLGGRWWKIMWWLLE
jgi:hypothetical protein